MQRPGYCTYDSHRAPGNWNALVFAADTWVVLEKKQKLSPVQCFDDFFLVKNNPRLSDLIQPPSDRVHGLCGSGLQTGIVGLAFLCSMRSGTSTGADWAAGIIHLDLG